MKSILLPISLLSVAVLGLSACSNHSQPNVELIQDMMVTPAIKSQAFDANAPHHSGMRVPPDGTVPVGFERYKYPTDPVAAGKELKNPFAGSEDEEVLFTGIKMYETNCALCHGHRGEGGEESKSLISAAMALKPPTLLSEKVRGMSDGQLYHIITMGQGVMGPYATHVRQENRWQLVTYLRQLQKNAK